MQRSSLAKPVWFLLFLAIAVFCFCGLGHVPLIGPDEPRYAEVAREMLSHRDLVTPTLNGLPWFEKPPLLYWMMMASYRVFGVNESAARLGAAICGVATAAFVFWITASANRLAGGRNETKAAITAQTYSVPDLAGWSTLVLLSSIGMMGFSRAASFDIVITMTMTGALSCFLLWEMRQRIPQRDERDLEIHTATTNRSVSFLLLGFYLFVGLSLLAKGLIGIVLPLGIIAFYFVLRREWPTRSLLRSLWWGVPLAAVVAAIWYGPMVARHGWAFIDQFIIQHHFARFLTNKYHHRQPVYFYALTIIWQTLPWPIFLGAALISVRKWSLRGTDPVDRLRVFALAWIIVPFVFFSISESKLAGYILPVVPAAAVLIGDCITCFLRMGRGSNVIRITGALLLALSGAGAWYALHKAQGATLCIVSVTCLPALTGAIAVFVPRFRRALILAFALSSLIAAVAALICGAPVIAQRESVRDMLNVAAQQGYVTTPIAQLFEIQRTAEFYGAGRLTYRSDGEPKMLESVRDLVDLASANGGTVLCLVPVDYEWEVFQNRDLTTEELARNGEMALLAVHVR